MLATVHAWFAQHSSDACFFFFFCFLLSLPEAFVIAIVYPTTD